MADHDLVAELLGYRNELAHCEALGETERAGAVRDEITRVQGEVREEAERMESEAATYDESGQGVRAAVLRNEARQYRALLDDEAKPAPRPVKRGPGRPRKEDTADRTPREKA